MSSLASILSPVLTLAQEAPPAAAVKPWWQVLLENSLPLTLLFIFLVAVIGVIFQLRRKDKCLKLLAGHHASYLNTAGRVLWGDLVVYSQGIELRFDAPHTTRQGLVKTSALIYDQELNTCLALCRLDAALTDKEKRDRQRQIRRSFQPGLFRRMWRWLRNLLNTLRDAFSKAITTILAQLGRGRPDSTVLTTQQVQVGEISQTLLGAAGNAYEPILEAHIGKPVVVKIASSVEPTNKPVELPGYLVDYSDRFIAVFNVEHELGEPIELEVSETYEGAGVKVVLGEQDAAVTCVGPEPVIVARTGCEHATRELALPLLPGCTTSLPRESGEPMRLTLHRTRRLDVVCLRSMATVHFGGEIASTTPRRWLGLAPWRLAEASRPLEQAPDVPEATEPSDASTTSATSRNTSDAPNALVAPQSTGRAN